MTTAKNDNANYKSIPIDGQAPYQNGIVDGYPNLDGRYHVTFLGDKNGKVGAAMTLEELRDLQARVEKTIAAAEKTEREKLPEYRLARKLFEAHNVFRLQRVAESVGGVRQWFERSEEERDAAFRAQEDMWLKRAGYVLGDEDMRSLFTTQGPEGPTVYAPSPEEIEDIRWLIRAAATSFRRTDTDDPAVYSRITDAVVYLRNKYGRN